MHLSHQLVHDPALDPLQVVQMLMNKRHIDERDRKNIV